MLMYFEVENKPQLFTVYQYKQLLHMVEQHFAQEVFMVGKELGTCKVYYNPESGEGVIRYTTDVYLLETDIEPLEYYSAEDHIKVKFSI